MTENHRDIPWLGPEFFENQRNFPQEELKNYFGQHIAWTWDGTRILASAPELDELLEKLEAAGINFSRVVMDYVDLPDRVSL